MRAITKVLDDESVLNERKRVSKRMSEEVRSEEERWDTERTKLFVGMDQVRAIYTLKQSGEEEKRKSESCNTQCAKDEQRRN